MTQNKNNQYFQLNEGEFIDESLFNFKKLSPDLLNILTKYMYVSSGAIETKLTDNNSLMIRKSMSNNHSPI